MLEHLIDKREHDNSPNELEVIKITT